MNKNKPNDTQVNRYRHADAIITMYADTCWLIHHLQQGVSRSTTPPPLVGLYADTMRQLIKQETEMRPHVNSKIGHFQLMEEDVDEHRRV